MWTTLLPNYAFKIQKPSKIIQKLLNYPKIFKNYSKLFNYSKIVQF